MRAVTAPIGYGTPRPTRTMRWSAESTPRPSPALNRRGALREGIRIPSGAGLYNRCERCGGPGGAGRRTLMCRPRRPAAEGGRKDGRGGGRARIHGVRRGDRRRGSVGPRRRGPASPARRGARPRPQRVRGREGLRGRRPYPFGGGDRAPRPRGALPGLARARGAPQHPGRGGALPLSHRDGRHVVADRAAPALAEEPRQLHHQPGEPVPLARRPGGGARGGGVPRLRRRGRALPRGRRPSAGSSPATWGSGATASPPTTSCRGWSFARSTPSSPKAAAATSDCG